MKIVVAGAGAWGTALAIGACAAPAAHQVTLWGRDAAQVAAMQASRRNQRYLPQAQLPESLTLSAAPLAPLAANSDLVIIATPMAALRATLASLSDLTVPVAWLCKGFERVADADAGQGLHGLLAHEIAEQVAPRLAVGTLSGPSFAREVAVANPTGLCDGLDLGLNARAALITRGLAEMTRLGLALGARVDTFMGLSGLGDLVLTATGDLSRNRQVGLLLAAGHSLQQAVDSLGHVAEGVYSARTVVQRARLLGVEMPISEAVVALLDGQLQPAEAVAALMGRGPKGEMV